MGTASVPIGILAPGTYRYSTFSAYISDGPRTIRNIR